MWLSRFSQPAVVTILGLCSLPAHGDESRYVDDRSSAAAVVDSLYNAVNRREYSRAWDYYGDRKPAKDVATFAKGYDDTARVDVLTGKVASEGAAGSTIYYVPVAIASLSKDGTRSVFAGCYTARLANPAIQDPPFRPLHIEEGRLEPSELALEDAVPESCPGAPAPDVTDDVPLRAKAMFAADHPACEQLHPNSEAVQIDEYKIPFRYASDSDEQPEREARLFRFPCTAAAYNEGHVYYQYDDDNGLRGLQFATPELDIRYEDDDSQDAVESISIVGYRAENELVNSFYDDASQSITSASKWRGAGDASSSGTWIFRNGAFTLVKYDVDASYDGEINPETVLDFHTPP